MGLAVGPNRTYTQNSHSESSPQSRQLAPLLAFLLISSRLRAQIAAKAMDVMMDRPITV